MTFETHIMAETILGETGGDSLSEMESIACVIMNRVHSRKKATPAQICLQKGQFKHTHQNTETLNQNALFQIAQRIAVRAINGLLPDLTKGAVRFHKTTEHPAWAHKLIPCAQVGDRLFYKGGSYA